jgi:ADP-ribose pyrophosphatase YjhB (NUDIX family)
MKFCSQCGAAVVQRIPEGDNLPRHVCSVCETIHYENPKVVAGCIPEWEGRLLLCRRAIEPRYGFWTLPAGFMENRETTAEAAARETLEEAGADVDVGQLFAMFSLPHINQVYLMFRGQMRSPDFDPGSESLDAALFERDEVPWDALSFPVIRETLLRYYDDHDRGVFGTHIGDIVVIDRAAGLYEAHYPARPRRHGS